MTSTPFEPNQHGDGGIPAADPGHGAPEPAPGFGVGGEEPDQTIDEPEGGTPGPDAARGEPTEPAD